MNKPSKPTQDQISQKAYDIYLARGSKPGNAIDDWLQAEKELGKPTSPETNGTWDYGTQETGAAVHLDEDFSFRNPAASRTNPLERDARGTPSREEIRTRAPHPAARQSSRRTEK